MYRIGLLLPGGSFYRSGPVETATRFYSNIALYKAFKSGLTNLKTQGRHRDIFKLNWCHLAPNILVHLAHRSTKCRWPDMLGSVTARNSSGFAIFSGP